MSEDLIRILRAASVEDADKAIEHLFVGPQNATHADALEIFNCMPDVLIGEGNIE
jgi:hypothetical protein